MALRNFDPAAFMANWSDEKYLPTHNGKTFEESIRAAFSIPKNDMYVYRAQGETTLAITQRAINGKRANGLHNWYHDEEGKPISDPYPTSDEITAYTSLFSPSASLPKALNAFTSNAKPQTLRSYIASYLASRFHNTTTGLLPSKKAREHINPYLSLLTYAFHELEWAGPWPATQHTHHAHHLLPVLYHHFGCVAPSHAALHVIARLAQPAKPSKQPVRPILDVGSGNGYWTFMLRSLPLDPGMKPLDVRPVDNAASEYRLAWVSDTTRATGLDYLARNEGGKDCVLLLVYPPTTGDFTAPLLRAFRGDVIVVAGTQNGNGFTGFADCLVDVWVEKNLADFELTLRMPLPSFPGKDEALFVFQRKTKT